MAPSYRASHQEPVTMVVISVSLTSDELHNFDAVVEHVGYDSRSSAIRDALHHFIAEHRLEFKEATDVVLTLAYDAERRQDQVHELVHDHQDIIQTSLHNHRGSRCLDVLVVHGEGNQIHELMDKLTRVKDVRVTISSL